MRKNRYRSPLLQLFAYSHLSEHLQAISRPFGELAEKIDRTMGDALDAHQHRLLLAFIAAHPGCSPDAIGPPDASLESLPDDMRCALLQSEGALARLIEAKDCAVRVHAVLPKAKKVTPPGPPDPPPAPPGFRVG